MNGASYPPANWTTFDYHQLVLLSNSLFAAGQANQASDGTGIGANIPAIDTAMGLNQYVCATVCGGGPYPFY